MTRSNVEALATDMRSDHFLIAIALLDFAKEILQADTECSSLRKPHWETLTHTVGEEEEFHFLTNLAVVALLCLFQFEQILVEHLLLREADAIHTSHHWALLVATPISSGNRKHFHSLDRSGVHEVRTTAKVGVVALGVCRDMSIFEFFNEFILVALTSVAKELQSICLGNVLTHQCFLALHEFLHFLLNLWEIRIRKLHSLRWHHVVVESVFNSRTNTELSAWIEFLKSFCHEVGRSVPESMLSFFIVPLVKHEVCIFVDWTIEFSCFAVHATSNDILCKARTNAFSDLQTCYTSLVFAH